MSKEGLTKSSQEEHKRRFVRLNPRLAEKIIKDYELLYIAADSKRAKIVIDRLAASIAEENGIDYTRQTKDPTTLGRLLMLLD